MWYCSNRLLGQWSKHVQLQLRHWSWRILLKLACALSNDVLSCYLSVLHIGHRAVLTIIFGILLNDAGTVSFGWTSIFFRAA